MPSPPEWLQNAAAIGESAAVLALLLTISIFIRDRRTSDRAQVDQLATWAEASPLALELIEGQPFWVNARVFLRNASKLPIEIVHVGVNVQSTWLVPTTSSPKRLTSRSGRIAKALRSQRSSSEDSDSRRMTLTFSRTNWT
jgi:hypothetical protein